MKWRVEDGSRGQKMVVEDDGTEDGRVIADNLKPEHAQLIGKVPDLLEHLQRLVRAIDRLPGNNPLDGLADDARKVIAGAIKPQRSPSPGM